MVLPRRAEMGRNALEARCGEQMTLPGAASNPTGAA
jgi:hypothetical protein